jgi:hypothetical protein
VRIGQLFCKKGESSLLRLDLLPGTNACMDHERDLRKIKDGRCGGFNSKAASSVDRGSAAAATTTDSVAVLNSSNVRICVLPLAKGDYPYSHSPSPFVSFLLVQVLDVAPLP